MQSDVHVDRRRVVRTLGLASAALVLLGVAAATVRVEWDLTGHELVWRFDLSSDMSVPTWFSSGMLALAALLVAAIAFLDRSPGGHLRAGWVGIAAVLTLMSIDEVATLHEWSGNLVDRGSGFLYYSWVVFGAAAVVLVVAVFGRFLLRQPDPFRKLVFLAGAIYVGGALGVEMLNGRIEESFGEASMRYVLGTAVEEALEFAGVLLLVHALLLRLESLAPDVRVRMAPAPADATVHQLHHHEGWSAASAEDETTAR